MVVEVAVVAVLLIVVTVELVVVAIELVSDVFSVTLVGSVLEVRSVVVICVEVDSQGLVYSNSVLFDPRLVFVEVTIVLLACVFSLLDCVWLSVVVGDAVTYVGVATLLSREKNQKVKLYCEIFFNYAEISCL